METCSRIENRTKIGNLRGNDWGILEVEEDEGDGASETTYPQRVVYLARLRGSLQNCFIRI